MIRINTDKLVKTSVVAEISPPLASGYRISTEGQPMVLPGVGGITYNIRVGDPIMGWEADHVEPSVSTKNDDKKNAGYNTLSCVGNEAVVVSGDAKDKKGVVTGKHGGIEHVLIDFTPEAMEKMVIGDKIMVKAFGVGLKLIDFPYIKAMNMSPDLFEKMGIEQRDDSIVVPITHKVPACIMGSGIGGNNPYTGDYDIQLFDKGIISEYSLDTLRFGDIVAIIDADNSFGPIYRKGAITIGIVVHSNCVTAGHGPGVTRLLTSRDGKIIPKLDKDANIAKILKLREDI